MDDTDHPIMNSEYCKKQSILVTYNYKLKLVLMVN
jgi:hypothetical protein